MPDIRDVLKTKIDIRSHLRQFRLTRDHNGAAHDVIDEPMRAEMFSVGQLEEHARTLAGRHNVATKRVARHAERLLPRLAENERVLEQGYEILTNALKNNRRITPAAEWFLDNYYLIEEEIRAVRRHLPRGYSRELPILTDGASAGYPRVYDIALELSPMLTAALTAKASVSSSMATNPSSPCGLASFGPSPSCFDWP
jgi:cyclic beta-1,2-glucan synthetase